MTFMVTAVCFLCLAKGSPGQWTLADGSKVSVIFVQPIDKIAWRPEGTPVNLATLPKPVVPTWTGKETTPILVALINSTDKTGTTPSVQFKLPATTELQESFVSRCQPKSIWISGYKLGPGQPAEQDVAVGVADGGWSAAGWVTYKKAGGQLQPSGSGGESFRPDLGGTSGAHAGPFTTVTIPTPKKALDSLTRVAVYNTKGASFPLSYTTASSGRANHTVFVFQGDFKTVGRIELQTRDVEWHTIRVAHFKPNESGN